MTTQNSAKSTSVLLSGGASLKPLQVDSMQGIVAILPSPGVCSTINSSSGIDMKKIFAAFLFTGILSGCATSYYTAGRDFPTEGVLTIVKGKTTSNELRATFGEPFAKSPVNETDEKWVYTYTNGSAHAQSYVVTMKVTTTGTQKTLDVLIRNDVVLNYTYTEGPSGSSSTSTR